MSRFRTHRSIERKTINFYVARVKWLDRVSIHAQRIRASSCVMFSKSERFSITDACGLYIYMCACVFASTNTDMYMLRGCGGDGETSYIPSTKQAEEPTSSNVTTRIDNEILRAISSPWDSKTNILSGWLSFNPACGGFCYWGTLNHSCASC